MEIRIRETGAVVTESEFRSLFPNTSFPQQLTADLIEAMGGDVVFEGPQATGGEFWQFSMRDGVEQIDGKWYTKHTLGPVFVDRPATETEPAATADEQRTAYIAQKAIERDAALQASVVQATQQRLDDFAKTRNYDGILSAATYSASAVPKFAAEGQYALSARDQTWARLYEILAEVQAGTRPAPTGFADIEPDLPALVWPQ
jgi:hypothetical protein